MFCLAGVWVEEVVAEDDLFGESERVMSVLGSTRLAAYQWVAWNWACGSKGAAETVVCVLVGAAFDVDVVAASAVVIVNWQAAVVNDLIHVANLCLVALAEAMSVSAHVSANSESLTENGYSG